MSDYDFAGRLKAARQRQGWSQMELGKRSGVHHMAISRLELGTKKDVTGATLRKLSLALGVTTDWLLELDNAETAPRPHPRRRRPAPADDGEEEARLCLWQRPVTGSTLPPAGG